MQNPQDLDPDDFPSFESWQESKIFFSFGAAADGDLEAWCEHWANHSQYQQERRDHFEDRQFWAERDRMEVQGRVQAPPVAGITYCPRTPEEQLSWSESSGVFVGPSCHGNLCSFCGPKKAYWTGRAMALTEPSHVGVFVPMRGTGAQSEEVRSLHKGLRRLGRSLARARGVTFFYAVGIDPSGQRVEARMVLGGPGIDLPRRFVAATEACGVRSSFLGPRQGGVTSACLELLAHVHNARLLKSVEDRVALLKDHSSLNQGRLVTASCAAAWKDGAIPLGSADKARKRALQVWRYGTFVEQPTVTVDLDA